MKATYLPKVIILGFLLVFSDLSLAQNWSYYDTANVGDMYYDKSRIRQVDQNITSVWTKNILSEKSKSKYYAILQSIGQAPLHPSDLSYYEELLEIDYARRQIKNVSVIFYDVKGRVIYASPASETGEWRPIEPNSVGEKLSNLVSWESAAPGQTAVPPKADQTTPAGKTSIAAAPATKKLNDDRGLPNDVKSPATTQGLNRPSSHPTKSKPLESVIPPERHAENDRENRWTIATLTSKNPNLKVIGGDARFVIFDNETVWDTQTNLMWAAKDNGEAINWYGAKKYCQTFRGGGYRDWRLPTAQELAGLYQENKTPRKSPEKNPLHVTPSIALTACCPWTSETRDAEAQYFDFTDGTIWWFLTPGTSVNRVLPVRRVQPP